MGTRIWNALEHFVEKSFLERTEEMVVKACAAVPEVGVLMTTLAPRLRDDRITFAHQLPPEGALQDRYDRWIVLSTVTPWLLRTLLLLEVGIPPQVLREKYLE
jgi:hypothetical protein